ncbi:AraC family transcriptional regulator [Flavobacterium sp. NKUCC04_CG]|uniref:helix-turn-helix domain-containing protein n=1 Tax=Flavobacterium sp. NKUCC04_CG TaxID=2842121 RepID=UPI001C5BCE15|nr:AraC family transcriptional regulator [Flavobacterium sp. NKUCC04_CG]MBW3519214.1 AraC family transcriptional regulator [Flavobacterium sp. NKUCC04_CG]
MMREIQIHRDSLQESHYVDFSEKAYDLTLEGDVAQGFQFKEVSFRSLQLVDCDYRIAEAEHIALDLESTVLEMHFRLGGNSTAVCDNGLEVYVNGLEHSILFHTKGQKKIKMQKTEKSGSFLEIRASVAALEPMFSQGNDFQQRFFDHLIQGHHYWPGYTLPITPEMFTVIHQLKTCPYKGMMKSFYLESKFKELIILQADAYDDKPVATSLKSADIEKLYAVKAFIDVNVGSNTTLAYLSENMLISTKKLTQGFKQLFNCSVFEYKTEVMMQRAKHLLLEEKLYVFEVSDRLGYKNQQHFTVAFKKRFGYLPSLLKQ